MQQRVITIILLIGLFFGLLSLGADMASWRLPDREQGYAPVQPIEYSHRLHAGELGIDCRFCHWASEHGRHAGIPSTDICMKCHHYVTMPWDQLQVLQQAEAEPAKKEEPAAANRTPVAEAPATKTAVVETATTESAATETAASKTAATKVPVVAGSSGSAGNEKLTATPPVENKLLPLYRSLGLDAAAQPIPGAKPYPIPWVRVHNLPDFVYFNHSAHMAAGMICQDCHGAVETMERVRQFASLSMGWCLDCHRTSNRKGIDGRAVNAPTNCAACHY